MGSMKDQLGDTPYPYSPGFERPVTSVAAAASMADSADSVRGRVFDFIAARADGATCDEVEVGLGLKHQTASARIRELVLLGKVNKPGAKRLTGSGRAALVAMVVR